MWAGAVWQMPFDPDNKAWENEFLELRAALSPHGVRFCQGFYLKRPLHQPHGDPGDL